MNVKQSKQAILAFVPVMHKGYLDFFSANRGDIFIFGAGLISKYKHLGRDVRAVDPADMVRALSTLMPDRNIRAASAVKLKNWPYKTTIMPDDEVCRDVAQCYFKKIKVKFVPVFLRWNKIITLKEFEIPAYRKITSEKFHKDIISRAFKEAAKSDDWWRQISALAVKGRKVVLASHNHHLPTTFHLSANGDPRSNFDAGQHQEIFTSIHAEAEIIAKAAREGIDLKGSTLYATTFPCPNCARLIGTAGVKRLYYSKGYSLLDAEKILDHFGVEVFLVE